MVGSAPSVPIIVLLILFSVDSLHPQTAEHKAIIPRNSTTDLTAAPGAERSPSKVPSANESGPSVDEQEKNSPGKSPSILEMLEGHERELIIAMTIAGGFFFLGWICGGNYYLRRDRRRRTKIRL